MLDKDKLQRLKIIVSQEQSCYDEENSYPYYKAYEFVLKEIDKLQEEEKDKKFSLTNKKNAKKFTIKRKNYDEAKHWLINHLDLSEEWTIKEEKWRK